MDKTPKAKPTRYSNNSTKPADGGSPTQLNHPSINDFSYECSPILSQCTSDNYNVDVIWDWNSPRSKTNVRRGKRPHTTEQEKPPLKKTPSGNHLPTFDQLKKKLDAIKEEITAEKKDEKPITNSSWCTNADNSENKQNEFMEDIPGLDELFNDNSFEQELILCSQKIENQFVAPSEDTGINRNKCEIKTVTSSLNNNSTRNVNIIVSKNTRITNEANVEALKPKQFKFRPSTKSQTVSLETIFDAVTPKRNNLENKVNRPTIDDSFESVLAVFENDDMELLSDLDTQQTKPIQDRFKDRSKCLETGIKPLPKSPQFRKTTSFDDSFLKPEFSKQCGMIYSTLKNNQIIHKPPNDLESLSKEILDKIEKKRKEALAKLEAKRKTRTPTPIEETSPIKCSPEEIEQKRLQALAKLEAKREQEIIERNRLEALKRLEINKKKRALELQQAHHLENKR